MASMHAPGYEPPVVEPIAVQDIYVSGLQSIEELGDGVFRFVLYVNQKNTNGDVEHVVVGRLISTAENARNCARESLQVLGRFFMRNCVECLRKGCH